MNYYKNLNENILMRRKLKNRMLEDSAFADRIKNICKNDILYWVNMFCWTLDPRRTPSIIPFICYDYQEEYISLLKYHVDNGIDLYAEKSRDVGATYGLLFVFEHGWQFDGPGNDYLLGSEKEQLVDHSYDPRALFVKLRFNINRQPKALMPKGYDKRKHDNYLRIFNPVTESAITGESNNKFFGTAGRYKAVGFDEFPKWTHTDEMAYQSCSDTTKCKIAFGSANGKNNYAYRLRSGQEGEIKVVTLLWKLHPLKTKEWYEQEKKRRSRADLAAEVDIDYSASIKNRAAESWNPNTHVGEHEYNPNLPLELNCDFNIAPMFWVVSQTIKNHRYTFKEFVYDEGATTERVITAFCRYFENHKTRLVYVYGDASGKSGGTRSRFSDYDIIRRILRINKFDVVLQVPLGNPSHINRLNAIDKRLYDWEHEGKPWETITPECPRLIESIEQTERKDDGIDKNGMEHGFDAWSYQIAKRYPVKKREIMQI